MLGKTHQLGGICSGLVIGTFIFPNPTAPLVWIHGGALLIGASLGSLMPDIDHPSSKIGRKNKLASKIVSKTMGHRGWTHTLIALVLIVGGLFYTLQFITTCQALYGYWTIGFSIGYLSHLILDAFTVQGIPAFKPFSKKNIAFTKFKTGDIDRFTQWLILTGTVFVMYIQYFK